MNISIIGTGRIAHTMAETVRLTEGAELYAVASRNIETAERFAAEFDIPVAYGSYAELTSDPNAGLVYIATLHHTHYEIAKELLNGGKNVLCEKPMTLNAKQAEELFKLADAKKLFICEALWTRFLPWVSDVKEILDSGIIGSPMLLDSKFGLDKQNVPRMTELELGGGAMLDLGIYTITAALLLMGKDFNAVETEAVLSDKGVDSHSYTVLKYPDGRRANITSAIDMRLDSVTKVFCTEGYVEIDGICLWKNIKVFDKTQKLIKEINPTYDTGYEFELRSCINAIKNGKTECAEIPHSKTLYVLKLMDKLRNIWGMKYPGE